MAQRDHELEALQSFVRLCSRREAEETAKLVGAKPAGSPKPTPARERNGQFSRRSLDQIAAEAVGKK